jgi:hypothetical protein
MKDQLFAVGFNELFGGVAHGRRIEPCHSTIHFSIQADKPTFAVIHLY